MKYVLDASAAVRWVLRNPHTPRAQRLRDDYRQNLIELIAPSHFPDEIASAITKAERQKLISTGGARILIQDVLSTPPLLYGNGPLLYRAVDLSSQTRTAYYDCLYVALAERENCELLTADDKLLRNLQHHFPFIKDLRAYP